MSARAVARDDRIKAKAKGHVFMRIRRAQVDRGGPRIRNSKVPLPNSEEGTSVGGRVWPSGASGRLSSGLAAETCA